MKYFDIKTVAQAYDEIATTTTCPFWGVLMILSCLKEQVVPLKSYEFRDADFGGNADRLFLLDDEAEPLSNKGKHFVIFPEKWEENVFNNLINSGCQPNLTSLMVWFYRNVPLEDGATVESLQQEFIAQLCLSDDFCLRLDRSSKSVAFNETLYSERDLLNLLKQNGVVPKADEAKTLKVSTKELVKKLPHELGAGPFFQPLYSGETIRKTLLLTPFNFFESYPYDGSSKSSHSLADPRFEYQTIYFGAPGTGKSHQIREIELSEKWKVFRTTFHPDYDYATFVGCYKPAMHNSQIVYKFVPQVFTQAYVYAWNNPDIKVGLVIEELNRGNCAQIFGDLFQLLDRSSNGFSSYSVKADSDLADYLKQNLNLKDQNLGQKNISLSEEILLPPNFFILATMNTSDQSLFPMDSAFKRRWAWKYIAISNKNKDYKIQIDKNEYDWWTFLDSINKDIYRLTNSEDKKMGYFFVKLPEGQTTIDKDLFVSKVLFYLWSDIYKDVDSASDTIFKNTKGDLVAFGDFFDDQGSVLLDRVNDLMQANGIQPLRRDTSSDEISE